MDLSAPEETDKTPNATPTARPSGKLCRVIAVISNRVCRQFFLEMSGPQH